MQPEFTGGTFVRPPLIITTLASRVGVGTTYPRRGVLCPEVRGRAGPSTGFWTLRT